MSTSITLEGFYRKAGKLIPWFMSAALVLFVVGVYLGFFVCPIEARQGNSYRIIFIHIPAAWLAMSLYLLMAVASIVGLLKNSRLAFILAQAMAPTGALMGFIALFSGAFWGRPTWGTYWVWDARLTSMLILFFLYLGFIALHSAIDDKRRADQAASVISIVGAVNVPIIYFSALVEHPSSGSLHYFERLFDCADHAQHHFHHAGCRHALRRSRRAFADSYDDS